MAYRAISGTVPQYSANATELASGYYLRGFMANSATPLAMATDDSGVTTLLMCRLNDEGYPISNPLDETTEFIPYFDQRYKLSLYPTEDDAINNTNAVWTVDGINNIFTSADLDGGGSGGTIDPVAVSLGAIAARMANGEEINVACFGDSTTDGLGTTSFTANSVDGAGVPNGVTDHNLEAPNAWPALLQANLRAIYGNANINTYNIGYSGRSISDGWAVANYAPALENPSYPSIPDVTFVQFGINDSGLGDVLEDFIEQHRLLIQEILAAGTLPILVSTAPIMLNGEGTILDNKEISTQFNIAKESIAAEFSIPVVDFHTEMLEFLEKNHDGQTFGNLQPDALHFGDIGHYFEGGFFSTVFFNDTIKFHSGDRAVTTWNSANRNVGETYARFTLTNNRQGGNIFWSGNAPLSTDVMTVWVWNTNPNAYLIYLGLVNENVSRVTDVDLPTVTVEDFQTGGVVTKELQNAGIPSQDANYRASDEQFIHSKLKYGLNKITYTTGTFNSAFYGCFRLKEGPRELSFNALQEIGPYSRAFTGSTGVHCHALPEATSLSNVVGGFMDEPIVIKVDATIPQAGGFLVLSGQGFDGSTGAIDENQQNGLLLFRGYPANNEDFLTLFNTQFSADNSGIQIYDQLGVTAGALPWVDDNFTGRIEISRGPDIDTNQPGIFYGTQIISVFDAFEGGTEIISFQSVYDAGSFSSDHGRFSGKVGGVFYNSDVTAADESVKINSLVIDRYPSIVASIAALIIGIFAFGGTTLLSVDEANAVTTPTYSTDPQGITNIVVAKNKMFLVSFNDVLVFEKVGDEYVFDQEILPSAIVNGLAVDLTNNRVIASSVFTGAHFNYVDIDTYAVTSEFGMNGGILGSAASPDGVFVVAATATNEISVFNNDILQEHVDISPAVPARCSFSSDSTRFACATDLGVLIYDTTGPNFVAMTPPASVPVDCAVAQYSRNAGYLAVCSSSADVLAIYDTSSEPYVRIADPIDLPTNLGVALAWNEDDSLLTLSAESDDVIYTYSTATIPFTRVSTGNPISPNFSYAITYEA